jgi:hypothetical protein
LTTHHQPFSYWRKFHHGQLRVTDRPALPLIADRGFASSKFAGQPVMRTPIAYDQ